MVVVDKIRRLSKLKGWTQGEFASLAGLHKSRISKWASDEGEPTLVQGLTMARLLGVPLEYLADDAAPEIDSPEARRELEVWRIVREIGPEEAWRRLVRATAAATNGAMTMRIRLYRCGTDPWIATGPDFDYKPALGGSSAVALARFGRLNAAALNLNVIELGSDDEGLARFILDGMHRLGIDAVERIIFWGGGEADAPLAIRLERHPDGYWQAFFRHEPGVAGQGNTPEGALGSIVRVNPERFQVAGADTKPADDEAMGRALEDESRRRQLGIGYIEVVDSLRAPTMVAQRNAWLLVI